MSENSYMNPGMSIEQVRADAIHGVRLARIAWRLRDPDAAGRVLGFVVQPGEQARKLILERAK